MAKLERVKGMITIKVQIKTTLGEGRLVIGRESDWEGRCARGAAEGLPSV